ncbi:MAG: hypothetical protein ACNYPE_10490 [Candidatus Azotimanducaceae bacterium WSBS_2022_MAG_OTU7]
MQRRLSATRTFFNYLAREGIRSTNPAMEFSAPGQAHAYLSPWILIR